MNNAINFFQLQDIIYYDDKKNECVKLKVVDNKMENIEY